MSYIWPEVRKSTNEAKYRRSFSQSLRPNNVTVKKYALPLRFRVFDLNDRRPLDPGPTKNENSRLCAHDVTRISIR